MLVVLDSGVGIMALDGCAGDGGDDADGRGDHCDVGLGPNDSTLALSQIFQEHSTRVDSGEPKSIFSIFFQALEMCFGAVVKLVVIDYLIELELDTMVMWLCVWGFEGPF